MKRLVLSLLWLTLGSGAIFGQNPVGIGSAPRLDVSGQGTVVPPIGAAPRLGPTNGPISPVFVPVDVTRNSVVPLAVVQRTAFRPHQPSILDRLAQLLPFATKSAARVVAPEAVLIHESLPNLTVK